jgi:hypothetical protein
LSKHQGDLFKRKKVCPSKDHHMDKKNWAKGSMNEKLKMPIKTRFASKVMFYHEALEYAHLISICCNQ